MAQKPRTLPPKIAAMRARKRQKLDDDAETPAIPVAGKKRKVEVNDLGWKAVAMPERMDDWEGILGLEEIDDVDVNRDDTGVISFHPRATATSSTTHRKTGQARDGHQDVPDDESWSGFTDDEHQAKPQSKKGASKERKKQQKPASKAKSTPKVSNGDDEIAGAFSALQDDGDADGADVSAWRALKLSPDTMAALSKLKFSKPTLIQQSVIPQAFKGHDVIGKASTGSGKTLAFGIPILERFLETAATRREKGEKASPLALILAPTRELAHQLEEHLSALFQGIGSHRPSIATLTGGLSLHKQQRLLKDADVIIGTPGRLWEIVSEGKGVAAALQQIDFLVIDEADRLLSDGHFKETEEILNALDRHTDKDDEETGDAADVNGRASVAIKRQTLVFSATFDRSLQKKLVGKVSYKDNLLSNKESLEYLLSKINFREEEPKFIDVNPVHQLAKGLKEGLIECSGTEKDLYLYALLLLYSAKRTMVFTNSISAVRRITPLMQNLNLNVLALHSGMPQKARLRSVEKFSQNKDSAKAGPVVLIATDVAARGLDIPNVDLVIHYHLPRAADTYVHRSGRTARAGLQGSSILICGPEEVGGVRRLVAKVHAQSAVSKDEDASDAAKQGYYIRTLDIDRRIVSRLKERLTLGKKIADATIAKEKQHKEDDFMRAAAEELGVDYDSEEFEQQATGKRGRGSGRMKKERESRGLTKAEVASMKAELKSLLSQRVNAGVSERYITSGNVDVDELLRQQDAGLGKTGEFLGTAGHLGLEDL